MQTPVSNPREPIEGVIRMRSTSPVLTFEKVLRAYGTGGFTYTEVVAQMERLLAVGASPAAVLEILRRRERIEPFPEYAHVEVVRLLNAAIARDAAEAAASAEQRDPDDTDQSSDSAGAPAGSGAGAEDPSGSIPTLTLIRKGSSIAAANPSASPEALRSLEQRVARQLDEHEMLTRSYERLKDTESAATARVAALSAEFAVVRGMLDLEQSKRRDLERALAESTASYDSTRSHGEEAARESKRFQIEMGALRDTLAARDAAIVRLMNSLAERDGQLAALQQEHARIVPQLEARAKGTAQLAAELKAAEARHSALQAERDDLQAQLRRLRSQLGANQAQAETMRTGASIAVPVLEISRATPVARSVADAETRGRRKAEPPAGKRPHGWIPHSLVRLSAVSFAVVVLAGAAWFFV